VNVGPLKRTDTGLCWWPGGFTRPSCEVEEKDRYVEASYRGFGVFASFTEAQYASPE
jgi:hypothetical protein